MISFSTVTLRRALHSPPCRQPSYLLPTSPLAILHSQRVRHISTKFRGKRRQKTLGLLVKDDASDPAKTYRITLFNEALIHASRALYADGARERLWGAYEALKRSDYSTIHQIPPGAWKHLWKTQSSHRPNDEARLPNLRTLVQNMKDAGLDVTAQAEILRLEETFAKGEQDTALKEWFDKPSSRQVVESRSLYDWISIDRWEKELAKKGYDKDWLELGIRLHAAAGRMTEMHSIIIDVARRFRNTDPRFVVYLILFLTSTQRSAYIERAWGFFCSLLTHDKFTISLHDFDMILRAFLGAGALHHAAAVVCAAVVAHGKAKNNFTLAIEDFGCKVLSACSSPEEVTTVALTILDAIPDGFFANPFFATWIRKTKEFEDPHMMALIIELMYEKDSKVTTWHLNQLLAMWLNGSPEQIKRGEQLAQSMIEKHTSPSKITKRSEQSVIKGFFHRIIPSGNVNTYIELMRFYAKQQMEGPVKQISEFLTYNADLELNENAIRGILSIHLIMGDMSGAWKFFKYILDQNLSELDTRTWAILWKGHHKYLASTERLHRYDAPTTRQLFKHMISSLPSGNAHDLPLQAMYEHITSSFCLSDDTVGLWAAMEAMNQIFDLAPSLKTINIIVKHVTIQSSFKDHVQHAPPRLWIEHLAASIRILERCYIQMQPGASVLSLDQATKSLEDLYRIDGRENSDETQQLMLSFLKNAAEFVHRQPTRIQEDLTAAKKEMGLDDSGHWEDVLDEPEASDHLPGLAV